MVELTDQNFEEELKKAEKPVLVDFFASWCQPCAILAPVLEKITKDLEGKFILAKVNLDNIPLSAQKFDVDRIPTVILFRKGEPIASLVGLHPEALIKEWLEENLLIGEYLEYAGQKGFQLNPSQEIVKRLVKGLLENEKKYGQRYCPCRRVSGNPEEDKPKICPCAWHRQEIEKDGHCFCGLFQK